MNHFITAWVDEPAYYPNDNQSLVYMPDDEFTEIEISDINKRVVTVFIDMEFTANAVWQSLKIAYGDEDSSYRETATFYCFNNIAETQYVTLQTYGNVSYIKLIYDDNAHIGDIKGIALNKPIPLKIFWPRVLLFFSVIFLGFIIKRKRLFFLALDEHSKWQKVLTVGIIAGFVLYLFGIMLLTYPFSTKVPFAQNLAIAELDQYNAEVVDALLDGHVYLDYEPTEALLSLENPYDIAARSAINANAPRDHVYYNGKFYSYFGIVPVLVLALPFKLIVGTYIPTRIAVFIFASSASIFLMLFWRRLVFRFMKDMPLGMYALGQLAVAMCSMVTFLMVRPYFYEVAGTSAMSFTALGLWLILGSVNEDKIKKIPLFLGCLSMALAVGCRPNYLFSSLFVPILLFDYIKTIWRDKKRLLTLCACVAAPYIVIGCALMWYNYIRFNSVFEFGISYILGVLNPKALALSNPIGKLSLIIVSYICYLLPSLKLDASFPFFSLQTINTAALYKGYIYQMPVLGVLALPITWFSFCLGYVKKTIEEKGTKIFYILTSSMLLLGLFQIAMGPLLAGGIVARYELDFLWLFVFPGLICAYFLYEQAAQVSLSLGAAIQKNAAIGIIISIALIFLLTLSGSGELDQIRYNNPAILYYIQRLLGFNTW